MNLPDRIGRFEIVKQLGRGGQGVVYLGRDLTLQRKVAIKTLAATEQTEAARQSLLAEARIVSALQHPGIVALYDAAEWQQGVYLVFEYVAGETLAQRLRNVSLTEPAEALGWILSVLDGLDYAHRQGVVHRDVKPSNIMLAEGGSARLTDFGIAFHSRADAVVDPGIWGAVAYLAPEVIAGKPVTAASDIYAMGLVMFEALTGRTAIEGRDANAMMYSIAHAERVLPRAVRPSLDAELDRIFANATAKDPQRRYATAAEMAAAIREFMHDDGSADARRLESAAEQTTLKFLLRKISRNSDFPAFSRHISEINRLAASDSEATVNELANVVLRDYSLTNKLLRLVNSSYYGQFGGKVNTVSRAVTIVGFDRIRSLAMGLVLFEQIRNRPQAGELVNAAREAFISAAVSRQMANSSHWRNEELYFVATLLHSMGRLMVIYYLPDEYEAMLRLVEQKGLSLDAAAQSVLGVGLPMLGRYVGRLWNFPKVLLQAMEPVTDKRPERPVDEDARVRCLSSFSNDLTQLLRKHGADAGHTDIAAHLSRYHKVLKIAPERLGAIVGAAVKEASTYVQVPADWGQSPSTASTAVAARSGASVADDRDPPADTDSGARAQGAGNGGEARTEPEVAPRQHRANNLLSGINEVTNMLVGEHSLNEIFIAILEVAYSSLGLNRALLLVRDRKKPQLNARFGFGADVQALLSHFAIPLDQSSDSVAASLQKGQDLLVEDCQVPADGQRLPAWLGERLHAASFAVYPLVVDGKLIAAIYVDVDRPGALVREEMMHLQTLRNQASLAIRQRHPR